MQIPVDEIPKTGVVSFYNSLQMRFDVGMTRFWVRDRKFVQLDHDAEKKRITFTPTNTKLPLARRVSSRMIGAKRVIAQVAANGCTKDRFAAILEDPSSGRFHIDYTVGGDE